MDILNSPRYITSWQLKDGQPYSIGGGLPFNLCRLNVGELTYTLTLPEEYPVRIERTSSDSRWFHLAVGQATSSGWTSVTYYYAWVMQFARHIPTGGYFRLRNSGNIPWNATAEQVSAAFQYDEDLRLLTVTGGPLNVAPINLMSRKNMSLASDSNHQFRYYFTPGSGIYCHHKNNRLATGDTEFGDPINLTSCGDKIVAAFATHPPIGYVDMWTNFDDRLASVPGSLGGDPQFQDRPMQVKRLMIKVPDATRGMFKVKGTVTITLTRANYLLGNDTLGYWWPMQDYPYLTYDWSTPELAFDTSPSDIFTAIADAIDNGAAIEGGPVPTGQGNLLLVDRDTSEASGDSLQTGYMFTFTINGKVIQTASFVIGYAPWNNYQLTVASGITAALETKEMRPANVLEFSRDLKLIARRTIGCGIFDLKVHSKDDVNKYKAVVLKEDSVQLSDTQSVVYKRDSGTFTYTTGFNDAGQIVQVPAYQRKFGINPDPDGETIWTEVGYMFVEDLQAPVGDIAPYPVRIPATQPMPGDTVPLVDPLDVPHSGLFFLDDFVPPPVVYPGNGVNGANVTATRDTIYYEYVMHSAYQGATFDAEYNKYRSHIPVEGIESSAMPILPSEWRDRKYKLGSGIGFGFGSQNYSQPEPTVEVPPNSTYWGAVQHVIYRVYVPNYMADNIVRTHLTSATKPMHTGAPNAFELRSYRDDWTQEWAKPIYVSTSLSNLASGAAISGNRYGVYPCLGYGQNSMYLWSDGSVSAYVPVQNQSVALTFNRYSESGALENSSVPTAPVTNTYQDGQSRRVIGHGDNFYGYAYRQDMAAAAAGFTTGSYWLYKQDRNLVTVGSVDMTQSPIVPNRGRSGVFSPRALCTDELGNIYACGFYTWPATTTYMQFRKLSVQVYNQSLVYQRTIDVCPAAGNSGIAYQHKLFTSTLDVLHMECKDGIVTIYGPEIDLYSFTNYTYRLN